MARWLGLGFREASARSRVRALEIYSTTEWAFYGTKLCARVSRRCARARETSRCQKEAAPSWELTGTRRRTSRTPAGSRARVRRPGGVKWCAQLGFGRGGVGDFIDGLRGANA